MDDLHGEAVHTRQIPWPSLCVLGWQWWSPRSPGFLPYSQQPCQESHLSHSIRGEVDLASVMWFEWKQPYRSGHNCLDEDWHPCHTEYELGIREANTF